MSSLIVVANRLPIRRGQDGEWHPSPGGLVSALTPCIQSRGGAWIGWTGSTGRDTPPPSDRGVQMKSVPLTRSDVQRYYEGYCNRSLWPLYHNAVRASQHRPDWWERYGSVNQRFAEATAGAAPKEGLVWIHDYQLQLVPAALRRLRGDLRIGFFLHIPFPPVDLFGQLPRRNELLEGLLGADVIGFQTERAATNFRHTAARLIPSVRREGADLVRDGRRIAIRVRPISIDVTKFERKAAEPAVRSRSEAVRSRLGGPRHLLVGVDRLDYTKGIDLRLAAFQRMLRQRPELAADTKLIQVAVPSREGVADYAQQRSRVERLVGEINGESGGIDRTPVYYVHRSLDLDELVALYHAADVMLVTPLCDGMNLVAKEYVVSARPTGALLLSEFAGAADELATGSILVNPWDEEDLTAGMLAALETPPEVRRERMAAMRCWLRERDVHRWAGDCLADLEEIEHGPAKVKACRASTSRSASSAEAPAPGMSPG
jgi:trehalose 6-phosphate synthase